MMNPDDFKAAFWGFLITAAVCGWAVIEGLIWVFGHVTVGWL